MKWKHWLTVAVLALLCVGAYKYVGAQERLVPLTVTLENEQYSPNVTWVSFPSVSEETFSPDPVLRIQHLVEPGVGPDPSGDRYLLVVGTHVGDPDHGHTFTDTLSFGATATCQNGPGEGSIERIACAVVKAGNMLVCSATYDGMDNPPPRCEGTTACLRCPGGLKVCGSDPECF